MIEVSVSKRYGEKTVLDSFQMTVGDGEIAALLGVSGSGKTTVLNAVCGAIDYEGRADAGGRVSYVFQKPRLAPWLTVAENLELVLRAVEKDKYARKKAVADMLETVELADAAKLYPAELSGGMEQRAEIARAFLYPSAALLMDEPWRGLDVGLKQRLTAEFGKLFKERPRATVFVSHDVDDALSIADRVVVLKNGKNRFETEIPDKARDFKNREYAELKEKLLHLLLE